MLRWKQVDPFTPEALNEKGERFIWRLYTIFFLGLGARILNVKAEKFSTLGLEFSISNKNTVPGLFFLAVLVFYAFGLIFIMYWGFHTKPALTNYHRLMLYRAAQGKTLLYNNDNEQIRRRKILSHKKFARFLYRVYTVANLSFLLTPLSYVCILEWRSVLDAIEHLYASSSL